MTLDKINPKKKTEPETVQLPCLYCNRPVTVGRDGPEMHGVFNVFCPDSDCEDRYAWSL